MVGNPPDPSQGHGKTTLLVVPSSALRQWEEEMAAHVEKGVLKKITNYKRTKEITLENLRDQDVIRKHFFLTPRSVCPASNAN